MSIDGLQNRADLERAVRQIVQKPGVLPPAQRPSALIKAGVPSDEDFDNPPLDGTEAIDSTGPTRYTRIGGAWVVV